MGCDCGKPKCDGHCGVSPAVLQINNPSECVLFHRVEVPASMGDSKTNPPKSGAYKNVLLYYEADQTSWLYSSDGIPQKLVNGLTDYEAAINLPQINGVTLLGDKNSSQLGIKDLFYINVTNVDFDEGTFTADKTYAEILEAYNAGKLPIVIVKEEDSSHRYNGIYMLHSYGVNDESDGFNFVYIDASGGKGRVDAGSWTIHIGNGYSRASESYGSVEIDNALNQYSNHAVSNNVVTNALLSRAVVFNTVADMKASTDLKNGMAARTLGFHTVNDGGGALYRVTNTGTANEMDVIAVGSLFANLINGDNVKQYGAYGDNEHDDSSYIQRAISANYHGNIHIPAGEYAITTPINITSSINITGEGIHSVLVKKDTSSYNVSINYDNVPFNFNDYPSIFNAVFPADSNLTYLKINGLQFTENVTGQTKATYAIVAPHLAFSTIQNCRYTNFNSCLLLGGWCNTVKKCEYFNSTLALTVDSNFNFINNKISDNYFNHSGISIKNAHNCSLNNCQADSVSVAYVFIDCNSISMINCSTEAWAESVRADNSFVTLQNCDLELHDKVNYTAFIVASNGAKVNVSDSYIHYEDYITPGEYPSSTNIVSNAGGSTIKIKNCKISIPFTYKDYISGNGVNEINNFVHSNVLSTLNKVEKTITAGNKVEIYRLPLGYNKKAQARVVGRGSFDTLCVWIEANVTAIDRGTQADPTIVDCDVKDNSCISGVGNASSTTAYITCEYDSTTREAVIYFNSSANYHYDVYTDIEFNLL